MDEPIRLLACGFDVSQAVREIDAHPEVWNRHRVRTSMYGSPHNAIDDIWVRYNAWDNFTGDMAAFNGPHESVWYPVIDILPGVKALVDQVKNHVKAQTLGGVLITRIPPGGGVAKHIDQGWHAQHYDKYAVQLKGNKQQAFCFDEARLSALPGDLYTFDNSRTHWVTNDSEEDRMTLIICLRGTRHD